MRGLPGQAMTKPDSTDAGGVTHEQARQLVRHRIHMGAIAPTSQAALLRYIDQQEAALATLTRELDAERAVGNKNANDYLRAAIELNKQIATLTRERDSLREAAAAYIRTKRDPQFTALRDLVYPVTELATPPAPLPVEPCHKCGEAAQVNDGDDEDGRCGPPVCTNCYDPNWAPALLPGGQGPVEAPNAIVGALRRWRDFLAADTADDDTREQAYRYIAAAHQLIGGIDSRHTKDHGLSVYGCAIEIAKSIGLTDYVEQGGEGREG